LGHSFRGMNAPCRLLVNSIEDAAVRSALPGREVYFGIVPRTALRLSWATFLASLREEKRRFIPRHNL
jgi:hypothetical protein